MNDNLVKKSFWSTIWMFTDTIASKAIAFVIGIVLARLLSPSDFGIIGMMLVFTSLCDVIIESGTSNALIRKTDRNDNDCSTALILNVGVALWAYVFLFIFSSLIAGFYNEPIIEQLLKFAGLNVILNALCIVPNALLIANFNTKQQAKINFAANFLSGFIALIAAFSGVGIWALIIQTLLSNTLKAIGYWLAARWIPNMEWSKESFSYLWKYSSKSFFVGLLGTFFSNIYNLVIGKFYTKVDLGYFARANQFVQLPNTVISSTFQRVSVATFAKIQEDLPHLLSVYRRYIHVICFLSFALFFCLAVIARPLVIVLLTNKWIICAPMLSFVSIGCAFSPLGIINICLLQAINKMDYLLKLEIKKKIVFVVILAISIPFGIIPMIIGSAIYNIIGTFMNMSCSRKFLNYRYVDQAADAFKYLFAAIIAAGVSYSLSMLVSNEYVLITVESCCFAIIYIGIVYFLKLPVFYYINELKQKVKNG